MCVGELLQEGRLHKERQPQLVRERKGLGQPEEHAVTGRQGRLRAPREQGFCPTQASDGDAQWREATQGRARVAEQEDGTLL